VKHLAAPILLIILMVSFPGPNTHDGPGELTAGVVPQAFAQERPRGTGQQTRGGDARVRTGKESFGNVKSLNISLDSAVVELRGKDVGTPEVSVDWRISCEDSYGGARCDPGDLTVDFRVENGVLRIGDTFQSRPGRVRPKLEITLSHSVHQPVKADVRNGLFEAVAPPPLELFLGNGSASLSGNLNTTTSMHIGNGGLDIDCLLSKGRHEFRIDNGSSEARFRKGSSFKYRARVRTGSVELDRPDRAASDEDILDRAEGTVGGGIGELKIDIGVGSLLLAIL
jgi:hypothetical protein